MAQAKLPDINTAIITYRNALLANLKKRNYHYVIMAVRAIIALMPKDYRITIDTNAYNEAFAKVRMIKCQYCRAKSQPINSITRTKRVNTALQELIYSEPVTEVWICKKCKRQNPMSNAVTQLAKPPDPYYLEKIPEPPLMTSFFSRLGYEQDFDHWIQVTLGEIENKIQLYRAEYKAQNPDDDTDLSEELTAIE